MSRDSTPDTVVIGAGMTALVKTNQNENEKERPTKKERAHKPVGKFEDMINLVTVLGGVRRLTEPLVDQREATHTSPDLPPEAVHVAERAFARDARC